MTDFNEKISVLEDFFNFDVEHNAIFDEPVEDLENAFVCPVLIHDVKTE